MYKVKMLTKMAGPEGNFPPGTIREFPNLMGKHLVETNQAELIEIIPDETVYETASMKAPEKAVIPEPVVKNEGLEKEVFNKNKAKK